MLANRKDKPMETSITFQMEESESHSHPTLQICRRRLDRLDLPGIISCVLFDGELRTPRVDSYAQALLE